MSYDRVKKMIHAVGVNISAFSLRGRIALFALFAVPVTSVGAGMTIFVDNSVDHVQNPIVLNDTVIRLDERIIVNFTEPIIDTKIYERRISSFPKEQFSYEWRDENRILHVIPRTTWKPETQYSIAFPISLKKEREEIAQIFRFKTIAYPQMISHNIENPDVALENHAEVIINFDQDIVDYDLQAVIRPFINTEQFVDKNGRNIRIKINEAATKDNGGYHSVTVFAKHDGQDDRAFYPIATTAFNTLSSEPEEWPEEFSERITVAKSTTVPKIKYGKYIDVNLSEQMTTLFEDGQYVTSFINSSGAKETPTPTGSFKVYNKDPYALSNMFGVYMPYWMAFTENGEYGLHGLIVWPEGHKDMPSGGKESENNIGSAVSPGCVRHDAENSKFIYDWTDVGTPIVIYE